MVRAVSAGLPQSHAPYAPAPRPGRGLPPAPRGQSLSGRIRGVRRASLRSSAAVFTGRAAGDTPESDQVWVSRRPLASSSSAKSRHRFARYSNISRVSGFVARLSQSLALFCARAALLGWCMSHRGRCSSRCVDRAGERLVSLPQAPRMLADRCTQVWLNRSR